MSEPMTDRELTDDEILLLYDDELSPVLESLVVNHGQIEVSSDPFDNGEPCLEFWIAGGDTEPYKVLLRDVTGWEADNFGSPFTRKIADVFDDLARKCRESADERDRELLAAGYPVDSDDPNHPPAPSPEAPPPKD